MGLSRLRSGKAVRAKGRRGVALRFSLSQRILYARSGEEAARQGAYQGEG